MDRHLDPSQRERQIRDIIYARGEPSVNEIQKLISEARSQGD